MKFVTSTLVILVLVMSVTASTELTDPAIISNLGFYAYEKGEYMLAEKLFLKALAEDPDYERARFNLATVYYEQERYEEAGDELIVLGELNPKNVQYHYNLGVNLITNFRYGTHDLTDFYAEITAYETAAQLDAGFAHVQDNLRVLYIIREEFNL